METIPILDFSKFQADDPESVKEVAEQVRAACHGIGFMYLTNHGIPKEKIKAAFKQSSSFFSLDQERKEDFPAVLDNQFRGFLAAGKELVSPKSSFEFRESFSIVGLEKTSNPFPDEIPEFKSALFDLREECSSIAKKLLYLFGVALDMPDENHFVKSNLGLTDGSVRSAVMLRANWYPPIPEGVEVPENSTRIGAHSDYGVVTLLFQDDVGGLEVKTAEGNWIPATPIPDSIVVNLGDIMEVWTGGYFKGTKHRVQIPEKEIRNRSSRMSIAYFVTGDDDYIIKPLTSNQGYHYGGYFEPMGFSDYYNTRIADSYR